MLGKIYRRIKYRKGYSEMRKKKKFVVFYWFVSWVDIAFGISIDIGSPKLLIHLPFGFLTIGWEYDEQHTAINYDNVKWRKKSLI